MGEKREFLANKQQAGFSLPVNELLWFGTCCRGGCDVRQSCWEAGRGDAGGTPFEVPLVKKAKARAAKMMKGHSNTGTCSLFLCCPRLGLHSAGCVRIWGCLFSFVVRRLEGCSSRIHVSRLLILATYINIIKCLSWWINNFHNLVLVLSSVSSSIFKLFQWFGICSLAETSGVVFLLDAFLLWSVAKYESSVWLACSGIHELCLLSLHSLHIAQYVLFPNTSLILRFGALGTEFLQYLKELFVV